MWFKSSEIFRVLGVQMASEVAGRGRSLFRTEGLPLPLIHVFFLRCLKVTNFQETRLLLKADINWDKASGLRIPYILTVESGRTQCMICMIYSSTFAIQINRPEYKTIETIFWVFDLDSSRYTNILQ